MGLPNDTTITWYGHSVVEIRTPGGKTVLIDPWFGNPTSPKAADAVDAATCCSSPTATTTTWATPSRSPAGSGRPGRASTR